MICYFSNLSPPTDTKISQSLAMLMEEGKKKQPKAQNKSEPIPNNKKCGRALSQTENILASSDPLLFKFISTYGY